MSQAAHPGLDVLLRALRLPTMLATHGETAARAEREGWGFSRYLTALCEQELPAASVQPSLRPSTPHVARSQ